MTQTAKTCVVEGCDRKYRSRGYCELHYRRVRRFGEPGDPDYLIRPRGSMQHCSVEGCDRKYYAGELCRIHYTRLRKNGDVGVPEALVVRDPEGTCSADGCDKPVNCKGLCQHHYNQAYRQRRRERLLAYDAHRRATDPEYRETQRLARLRWRERYPERHKVALRKNALKTKYGLTLEAFYRMFITQAGVCAICRKALPGLRANVDHCHVTGRVRGLLCENCNRGLGIMQDNPSHLRAAAEYLERA